MTWVAVGVGVAGAATSASSASKAGKSAKRNAQSQQALMAQDLEERKRVARRQDGIYGPIEEQIAAMATAKGIDPLRAGVIRQRVGTEFNAADRNIVRMIGNRGVSSGLGASLLGASQMNRARAMASGVLGEYQNKDAMRMQLLSRYNPLQNAEFQSQGLRGMAGFYGAEADRARQAERMGWDGAARGLMGAATAYASRANTTPDTTITSVNLPSEGLSPIDTSQRNFDGLDSFSPGVMPSGPVSGTYQYSPISYFGRR